MANPPKPSLDVAALGAQVSQFFVSLGRGLGRFITQTRVSLARAAGGISHEPTRKTLVALLQPRALPPGAASGPDEDLDPVSEARLRTSGGRSGVHSQPSLRSSGVHSQPSPRSSGVHSQPDLSGGSNPRPSGPMKRVKPRMGGTFTAAAANPSGPKHSLTGGSKKLSEDELEAIKHDAQRRREEAKGRALIDEVRGKLGKFKLEKLSEVPRTFAPEPLAAFKKQFPSIPAATIELVMPLLIALSRDVCDRAAVRTGWSEAERVAFVNAIPPESRERLKPAIEAVTTMNGEARQALLRLPRAPVMSHVDTLAKKWATLPAEEIRAIATALAHFSGAELAQVIRASAPPVKIAPKGIRG